MSYSPKISVIIPTYNREESLNKAIETVFAQTIQDFEIIVVDDGSTDNTNRVINDISDPRIHYLQHEQNRGVSAARNTGMRAALGEYIAWLDSDDSWLPTKLEDQYLAMQQAPDDVGVCCTGYYLINERGSREVIPFCVDTWFQSLLLRCEIPGPVIFFRKNILDWLGPLDEQLRRYEDWDWLIRYSKSYQLLVVEKLLVRHYPSAHPDPKVVEESAKIFIEKHRTDIESFGPLFKRRAIARRWMDIAWAYYRSGSGDSKVRKYLALTITTHPLTNPEAYLGLFDMYFGTKLLDWAINRKEDLSKIFFKKSLKKLWS